MPPIAQKRRILDLLALFKDETDENHSLGWRELSEKLEERGIKIEHKTLVDDIDILAEFGHDHGFEIEKVTKRPISYAMTKRNFDKDVLALLAYLVQSSWCISKKDSDRIMNLIGAQGSKYQREYLKTNVHVSARKGSRKASELTAFSEIREAINRKKCVQFLYLQYRYVDSERGSGVTQTPKYDGVPRVVTPVQVVSDGDLNYLVAWDSLFEGFKHYRLDRMADVRISDIAAAKNEQINGFDFESYFCGVFGMYKDKESVEAKFRVDESVLDQVVDKFGADGIRLGRTEQGKSAGRKRYVYANVVDEKTFYAWLANFSPDEIFLEGPEDLKQGMAAHFAELSEAYN